VATFYVQHFLLPGLSSFALALSLALFPIPAPPSARSFLLFTMSFTLTLEDGRNFLSNNFSKTQLQVEIQKRQAAGLELPTHKTELRSKLSSLIKQELIGRGSHGSLPDWRRIDSLTVAQLRKEIRDLNGSGVGNKSTLCGELERLNRTSLGFPAQPDLPNANAPFASQLSPHAAPYVPMGPVPLLGGLQTPELLAGAQDTSPPDTTTATPQDTLELVPPAAEVENSIFYFSPGESTNEQADPMINVAPGAALRVVSERLMDATIFSTGQCPLTTLCVLFSQPSLDNSASLMPFGSILTLQALTKLHNAIAAKLLDSRPVFTLNELTNLCHELLVPCSITLSAVDFVAPVQVSSLSAAQDILEGICVDKFRTLGLYKYSVYLRNSGGLTTIPSRDPSMNEKFKALLDDTLTPASPSGGGILPSEVAHLPFKNKLACAFEQFLVFKHIDKWSTPFELADYFRLRQLDVGIRIENPEALDANLPNLLRSPTSGLTNVQLLICDTPPHQQLCIINHAKALLFDHSVRIPPNSLRTMQILNAKLADFPAALQKQARPLSGECQELTTAPALERIEAIRALRATRKDLSSHSSHSSTSSGTITSNDAASATVLSTAVLNAAPLLQQLAQFPQDTDGRKLLLETAMRSKNSLLIWVVTQMPTRQLNSAYPILGTLHSIAMAHLPSFTAKMLLIGVGQPGNPGLHLALTNALDYTTLINILKGNFPSTGKLLEMYGRLRSFLGGARHGTPTTSTVSADLNEFEKFITFISILLTALGFNAEELLTLVTQAKYLESIADFDITPTMEKALLPSLTQTLNAFSAAVRTWALALDIRPPERVIVQNELVQEVTAAVLERNKQNLSLLGIPSLVQSPFGWGTAPTPGNASSNILPTARTSSAAQLSTKGNKRAKANHFSQRSSGPPSQGSNANPPAFRILTLKNGRRAAHWNGYFDVTGLIEHWKVQFPSIPWHDSFLPCICATHNPPGRFMSFIPVGTPEATVNALQTWYDSGRGRSFKIDKPADFR
jgi:hypothetical protein